VIIVRGVAELIALAATALAAVVVIREVGPATAGVLAFTTTILYLAAVVVGGGIGSLGAQLVAASPEVSRPVFRQALRLRMAYATVWVVLVESAVLLMPLPGGLRDLLAWTAPGGFLVAFRNEWFLVGRGAVGAAAGVRMVSALGALGAALTVVHGQAVTVGLAAYVLATPVLAAAVSTGLAIRRLGPTIEPRPDADDRGWRSFATAGLAYLQADVSIFVSNNSDRVFLYAFGGAATTGIYDAAYKLIQPFAAISSVVGDSMFLALTRAGPRPGDQRTFRRFVDLMFVVAVPVGFVAFGFGRDLIELVYGTGFRDSGPLLGALGWVVTTGYLSGVLAIPFSAWHAPREYGNSVFAGSLTNIVLNVVLIPPFLGLGAALATVAAKLAVVIAAIGPFRARSEYPVLSDFVQYCVAAAVALIVSLSIERFLGLPWVVGLALFGAVYGSVLAAFRVRPRPRRLLSRRGSS
jgi:O-antigen/teichoic acid export membrane protein